MSKLIILLVQSPALRNGRVALARQLAYQRSCCGIRSWAYDIWAYDICFAALSFRFASLGEKKSSEGSKLEKLLAEQTIQTTKIENHRCVTSTVNNRRHTWGRAVARCTSRNLSLRIFSPYSLISKPTQQLGGASKFPLL